MARDARTSDKGIAGRQATSWGELLRRVVAIDAVALVIALALMVVVFSAISPHFLNAENVVNIARSVAVMGIAAAGVTVGLIGGVFDLSINAVADLAIVVASISSLKLGLPPAVSLMLGLSTGVACGAVNGLIVTRLRINPIIGTIGTGGIFAGIAFLLTGGRSHAVSSAAYMWLGRTMIFGRIPSSVIAMLIVMAICLVVLRYTKFGRVVYAIGGNPLASRLAGIDVDRMRLYLFMFVSFFAALSGLVLLSKLGTMIPNAAEGTMLTIIAAAILGGTALTGGGGTVQGTLVGVLILGTLQNGLQINNVNPYWQQVASGIALIVAVGIDYLRAGGYR